MDEQEEEEDMIPKKRKISGKTYLIIIFIIANVAFFIILMQYQAYRHEEAHEKIAVYNGCNESVLKLGFLINLFSVLIGIGN